MPDPSKLYEILRDVARNADQMAAHLNEIAALFANGTVDKNDQGIKKRRPRAVKSVDPLKPEKPKHAYLYFVKDTFNRTRGENSTDTCKVMSIIAKKWKELSDTDKKEYKDKAANDKVRYEREMNEFTAYREDHPFDPATEGITESPKKRKRKLANALQTRPTAKDDDEQNGGSSHEDEVSDNKPLQENRGEKPVYGQPESEAKNRKKKKQKSKKSKKPLTMANKRNS